MRRLVLASRNKGKLQELRELLAGLPVEVTGLEAYPDAPEVLEDGATFAANALLKAKLIAAHTGELTLADDSGLEVDALNGEPGVYSARYGQSGWNDRQRYEYLLSRLSEVALKDCSARFRCAVALYDPKSDRLAQADGTVEGLIVNEPRGANGFGYDPIFYLPEYQQTMAELESTHKNRLSHRGRALRRLMPKIKEFIG